jgi:hypothetical protein
VTVADDGDFDEDNTFVLSDWFKHTPPEVLEKNFGVPAATFVGVPDPSKLYIFAAPVPGPLAVDRIAGATEVPQRFSHRRYHTATHGDRCRNRNQMPSCVIMLCFVSVLEILRSRSV